MKVPNESLMEQMLGSANLGKAWKAVKSNKGSAGIDGIEVADFIHHIRPHWSNLKAKIERGDYKPAPVKRVYIPKGSGEVRPLGIPSVQDRFLCQAMLQIIQPVFEEHFSAHSYGFRPGRGTHDAIQAAQQFVKEGKVWVVDIDLKSFFDEVNHDLLMNKVRAHIQDKEVRRFIGKYLRAGVLENRQVIKSMKGVPQGNPLSPLLANLYLDDLDKELEKRGLSFSRYADDCNIYVSSRKAAERVYASLVSWIEKHLKLQVNRSKSGIGQPWERQFLGYRINAGGTVDPSDKSIQKYKAKICQFFDVRKSLAVSQLRNAWVKFIRGWSHYFSLSESDKWRHSISGWTRRHMRKYFWLRWHSPTGRRRQLLKLGVKPWNVSRCHLSGSSWRMSRHPAVQTALKNITLRKYGFLTPSDFCTESQ